MAIRRRTSRPAAVRWVASLAIVVGSTLGVASVAAAQDPGFAPGTGEVVPVQAEPSTPEPSVDQGTTETTGSTSTQTLIEGEQQPARRVATESRRVMAVIAGLVLVALALALLTARYVRITKPVPLGVGEPDAAPSAVVSRRAGRRSRRSVAGADHAAADEDWEPHATGEHAQIDLEVVGTHRPGRAARRRALGLADPA